MKNNIRVNQIELAAELGLTDRRVRQLCSDHILPEPDYKDGRFDLALCRERFDLYKNGSDRDWQDFYRDIEGDTEKTKSLIDQAYCESAAIEDVTAASLSVQSDFEKMRFVTACRSQSQAEKNMFFLIWKKEEDQTLGGLVYRAVEILGGDRIVDADGTVLVTLPPKVSASRKTPSRRARRAAAAGKPAKQSSGKQHAPG